ncbi:MAG: protein kinase [Acutalibacteraceae bacterium]
MQTEICYNCFQENETSGICPLCGFDAKKNRGKYPLALPFGTVLGGKYILGKVLGQGGFGITYVAQNYQTKELVAVKEYFPDSLAMRTDERTVASYSGEREENFLYGKECFLDEAKTLAEFIGNPNIVCVYSYFEENNTAYFAMEYIRGISFQGYINQRGGKIPWEDARRVIFPVMDALSAVHGKGIIHRDISPDNIYITNDGTVKLLDFGAARYSIGDKSRSLDVVLKHGYAPKEQYTRHGRQGPFTDVYALAATIYRAITGRVPPDSIDRIDEDELILPSALGSDISARAEDALVQALSVQSSDRFQSMKSFREALGSAEPNQPTPEPPIPEPPIPEPPIPEPPIPEPPIPAPTPHKKRKVPIVIAASSVALIVICVLLVSLFVNQGTSNVSTKTSNSISVSQKEKKNSATEKETEEPQVVVSSYKNVSYSKAKSELEDLGFTVKTEYEYSDSVKEDYVISQSIEEGTRVVSPSTITLTVSKGKEIVETNPPATEAPKKEPVSSAPSENRVNFYYYSLVLPDGWMYFSNEQTGEVTFYESYNYTNGDGLMGRLFSINVFNSEADINSFKNQGRPRTTIIGVSNGLYFTSTLPTDVQYMSDSTSESKYKAAQSQIDSVLASIVFS